ncbi:MAG: VOC family protein [Bacteroidales bacterium]|nr:VOC family protein [Bacteroidales bacterium]
MIIDHICFAVDDLDKGILYWTDIYGYRQASEIIINTRQKVKVVFLTKENSVTIKLIEPTANKHSYDHFYHINGGFHHLCFKCTDMYKEIEELQHKGLKMLVPPEPGEAFNDNDISFLLDRNGLIIEMTQSEFISGYSI